MNEPTTFVAAAIIVAIIFATIMIVTRVSQFAY